MAEQVGDLLGKWRRAAGWSLGQLAKRAGISKSALSQWEAGLRQPRVPELEATLTALGTTPAQRAQALTGLTAPRSLRLLHIASPLLSLGPIPIAGDLLRALRLRRSWTQAQVAFCLGVGQNTVARWEQGERLPSQEHLQALCFALEAREEELIALTTGCFVEVSQQISTDAEAVHEHLRVLLHQPRTELVDLRFLLLERELWRHALQGEPAQSLLARAYAEHAHYLSLYARWEEARQMAQRALDLTHEEGSPPNYTLRAVLKLAAVEVYGGTRPAPGRGIQRILPWLPRALDRDYAAWMLSDMGKYLAMAGQPQAGLELGKRAIMVTAGEHKMRQLDYSRMLLDTGDAGKALEQLPDMSETGKEFIVYQALIRCEAHLALGEREEASRWLARAYAVIEAEGLQCNLAQADALARQF